jgi:hypothetical protein
MLVQFIGWNILLIVIANIIIISLNKQNAWGFGAAGLVYILAGCLIFLIIERRSTISGTLDAI